MRDATRQDTCHCTNIYRSASTSGSRLVEFLQQGVGHGCRRDLSHALSHDVGGAQTARQHCSQPSRSGPHPPADRRCSAATWRRTAGVASRLAARPAMSSAEPCTGSYSDLRRPVSSTSPSDAEGSMPSEPVSIAAVSDSMSPNRLSVTMTSNCFGARTKLHGAVVGVHVVELDIGEFFRADFGHFLAPDQAGFHDVGLLDGHQTLLPRLRARSKATAATRRISEVV